MGSLSTALRAIHVLLLGLVLGSICLLLASSSDLSEVVRSLHTRDVIYGKLVHRVDLWMLFATPILLITLFGGWMGFGHSLRFRAIATAGLGVVSLLLRYWILPQQERIRLAMGRRIEDLSAESTLLIEYRSFETFEQIALWFSLGALFVLLVLAVARSQPRRSFGISL